MKKSFIMALALVLVLGIAIGGTVAWLTDTTNEVKNTFTVGNVVISLTETWNTDTDGDNENDAWQAQLVPGKEYSKNPVVSVDGTETNVDVYLFVKFEETNDPDDYLTYTSNLSAKDSGWTKLTDVEGVNDVWYRVVKTTDKVKRWDLLKDSKVTVKDTLTKETMPAKNATPELKYTAAAIQTDGFDTAADAWAKLPAAFTGATA